MMNIARRASVWLKTRSTPMRGAALVEYALLVALVALVCVAALTRLNTIAASKYSQTASVVGQ